MDLLYDIELRIIGSAVLGAALCAYLLRVRLFYYGLSMPAWALPVGQNLRSTVPAAATFVPLMACLYVLPSQCQYQAGLGDHQACPCIPQAASLQCDHSCKRLHAAPASYGRC